MEEVEDPPREAAKLEKDPEQEKIMPEARRTAERANGSEDYGVAGDDAEGGEETIAEIAEVASARDEPRNTEQTVVSVSSGKDELAAREVVEDLATNNDHVDGEMASVANLDAEKSDGTALQITIPATKPEGRPVAQHRASPRHGNNLRAPTTASPMGRLTEKLSHQMQSAHQDSSLSGTVLSRDEVKHRERAIGDHHEVDGLISRWDPEGASDTVPDGRPGAEHASPTAGIASTFGDSGDASKKRAATTAGSGPGGASSSANPEASATSPRKHLGNEFMLTPVKQQELHLQHQFLHELHRDFNLRKEEMARNTAQVTALTETLAELERKIEQSREVDSAMEMNGRVSQKQAQELQRLKSAADRRLGYIKTLSYMNERLERNKLVHDTRIEELKKVNEDLEKELTAHNIRLREAVNNERVAVGDLDRVRRQAEQEEAEWADRVEARRQVMRETEEILEFREHQLAQKTAIIAEVKGDLDAEGEQNLQRKVITNKLKQLRLQHDISQKAERIDEYERAFKRIVEATGNTSMSQIVEKFMSQADTVSNLKAMIAEAEAKIVKLSEDKHISKKESESIRFGGIGHASKQRKLIDDKEVEIETAVKVNKQLMERTTFLQNVMRGIKDGVNHIVLQLDIAQIPSAAALSAPGATAAAPIDGDLISLAGMCQPSAGRPSTSHNNSSSSSNNNNNGAAGDSSSVAAGATAVDDAAEVGGGGSSLDDDRGGPKTFSNGDAPGGSGAPEDDGDKQQSTRDISWYLETLAQCEKRIMKVLETLPDKNLRIDDVDETILDSVWRNRLAANLRGDQHSSTGLSGSHAPFSKARMKKLLRMQKRLGQGDGESSSGAGHRKSKARGGGGQGAMSASKMMAKYKTLTGQVEKLRAHVHESNVRAQEAERHLHEVKQNPESSPEVLLKAEDSAQISRADADRAQRALKKASADLEGLEQVLSRVTESRGVLGGGGMEAGPADSASEDDDDEDGKSLDDGTYEGQIPVVADKEGRELIKAENRRILKFAEKKRKRATRMLSQKSTEGPDNFLEHEVMEATRQETRRFSMLRPQHSSRLALAKASAAQQQQLQQDHQQQQLSQHSHLGPLPQSALQSMPE